MHALSAHAQAHARMRPCAHAPVRHAPPQDLFKHITRFRPERVEPPAPLKPFIPEYIPALGGVDEFVKVRAGEGAG